MSMYYRIVRDGKGSGGFLSPPGHPDLTHSLRGWPTAAKASRSPQDPHVWASISYALDEANDDVPESVREQARKILAEAELKCPEGWLRQVYGYFAHCYSPDGTDRNVSHCVIDADNRLPAEHHLAYLTVRQYFPDHAVRADLIDDPARGYGSYACPKCHEPVQYEARFEGYCAGPGFSSTACPAGGEHEREFAEATS